MSSKIKTLDENIAAFMAQEDDLIAHYKGKWVVFYDGALQDSFDSFNSAAKFAVSRFREGPYLIRQVGGPSSVPMPASVAFRPIYAHS